MFFLQKNEKSFERWGLRPQTPVPPAAEGFAPRPPASGGWELCPQIPIGLQRLGAPPILAPPHCEFLATRLLQTPETAPYSRFLAAHLRIIMFMDCQFLCHILKALVFIKISFKLVYFFAKKIQILKALGTASPDPQNSLPNY